MADDPSPPVCIQILSTLVLVCFGLYCIVKGASMASFSWWLVLGTSCLLAAMFASFRLREVCLLLAQREQE